MNVFQRPTYLNFCRSEAALIDTDGCSKVTGLKLDCCLEHDLSFYYGRDPRDAYLKFRTGSVDYWADAKPIAFDEANRRFRKCHQARSVFGRYSPMALWRWLGVHYLSRRAWAKHRLARP
jgi:hypothetical protein